MRLTATHLRLAAAKYAYEYCHSLERLSANRFTIDPIIPKSLGSSDEFDNLALACRRCNERRYNFVAGIDPETQEIVPIFNPRQQKWAEHFVWLNQAHQSIESHYETRLHDHLCPKRGRFTPLLQSSLWSGAEIFA